MFDYSDMSIKRTEKDVAQLYDVMRCDMGVMSEHGSEKSLLTELQTCDNEILETYIDTFLR